MDYFYDGQIRRYVTQFMRFFIGFKYQAGDGEQRHVPVAYGDMTRQVASIIRDNSENKMPTVPRISCYITGIEQDITRLTDPSFVSKINIRERDYDFDSQGEPVYKNVQGGHYTVERLIPTPYTLNMKADIWTSNTDQKLQLLEQILVFFNPSFEIQTTDNYIDWTSLSVINLKTASFSSRTIPVGTESDIDICSLDFSMPIYISTPAKVKKLGVVQNIIMNIFTESGDIQSLENLTMDLEAAASNAQLRVTPGQFGILLLKSNNGQTSDYDVSVVDVNEAVNTVGLDAPTKVGRRIDWNEVIAQYGNYKSGISKIHFEQSDGTFVSGTFTVNQVDSSYLVVTIEDAPSNTSIPSSYRSSLGTVDAIIDPYKFNPVSVFGSRELIPAGTRYLILDDVNTTSTFIERSFEFTTESKNIFDTNIDYYRVEYLDPALSPTPLAAGNIVSYDNVYDVQVYVNDVLVNHSLAEIGAEYRDLGGINTRIRSGKLRIVLDESVPLPADPINDAPTVVRYVVEKYIKIDTQYFRQENYSGTEGTYPDRYSGPDAWKNLDRSDPRIRSNSIIEWSGTAWNTIFDPDNADTTRISNLRTGIQYRWDGQQWLKSFEGEYQAGFWRFDLNP